MKVDKLLESGYDASMYGLSLSFNAKVENMPDRAKKLAFLGNGHSNFLEQIMVWLDVTAPRYWWSQADRYRMSSRQSESTMHTICSRPLTQQDFAEKLPVGWLAFLNQMIQGENTEQVKTFLPEGFLQTRVWLMSYKTLQNIISQRKSHKLKEWRLFVDQVLEQVDHPELLIKEEGR